MTFSHANFISRRLMYGFDFISVLEKDERITLVYSKKLLWIGLTINISYRFFNDENMRA